MFKREPTSEKVYFSGVLYKKISLLKKKMKLKTDA